MTTLHGHVLVLDACTVINLAAAGKMDVVRMALGCEFRVVRTAYEEAELDPGSGLRHTNHLQPLVDAGVLVVVDLDDDEQALLVEVAAEVGDGEAATIAHALNVGGVLVTDDGLAAEVWRSRTDAHTLSTIELLRKSPVEATLGLDDLRVCTLQALMVGRMRAFQRDEAWLEALLLPEQLVSCRSLRSAVRERARSRLLQTDPAHRGTT